MASRRSRPRRLLLPTILAAVLAAEITGMALARTMTPAPEPAPAPAAVAAAAPTRTALDPSPGLQVMQPRTMEPGAQPSSAVAHPTGAIRSGRSLTATARATTRTAQPKAPTTTHHRVTATTRSSGTSYHGVNHVWIPSLGVSAGTQSFPCSRSRPPDAGVYRWGCAGTNNVYLLSHAWSTFRPLHDAYSSGRLRKGMKVVYADAGGRVHTYSVIWWKVTAPTTAASWAWAPLSRPGMTLQTCVGANSAYRLMVRLVQVG
jgi:hypothetical protein